MPPRKPAAASQPNPRSEWREEIHRLGSLVDGLSDTVERTREELNSIVRNGITLHLASEGSQCSLTRRSTDYECDDDDNDEDYPVVDSPLLQGFLGAVEKAIDTAQADELKLVIEILENLRDEIVAVIGEEFTAAPAVGTPSRSALKAGRPANLFEN